MSKSKLLVLLLTGLTMVLLAACAGATPETITIVETVEVEKEVQVKKCSVCGEVKPLGEFYRISASRGRRPDCKGCRRAYQ